MNSPIINFGKHKGKTYEYIFENDIQYLKWLLINAKTYEIYNDELEMIIIEYNFNYNYVKNLLNNRTIRELINQVFYEKGYSKYNGQTLSKIRQKDKEIFIELVEKKIGYYNDYYVINCINELLKLDRQKYGFDMKYFILNLTINEFLGKYKLINQRKINIDRGFFRQNTVRDSINLPFSDDLDYLNSYIELDEETKKYYGFENNIKNYDVIDLELLEACKIMEVLNVNHFYIKIVTDCAEYAEIQEEDEMTEEEGEEYNDIIEKLNNNIYYFYDNEFNNKIKNFRRIQKILLIRSFFLNINSNKIRRFEHDKKHRQLQRDVYKYALDNEIIFNNPRENVILFNTKGKAFLEVKKFLIQYHYNVDAKSENKTIVIRENYKNNGVEGYINSLINTYNNDYDGGEYVDNFYFISRYDITFDGTFNDNTKETFIKNLKAFSPLSNKKYHDLTICSTTKSRLCIIQTYYYLYVSQEPIKKNEKKIDEFLNTFPSDVIKMVKNGELCNFLLYLSNINKNQIYYCEFFEETEELNGFYCLNGETFEINGSNMNMLINQPVFLYSNLHVAPRRKIDIGDLKYNECRLNYIKKLKYDLSRIENEEERKLLIEAGENGLKDMEYNANEMKFKFRKEHKKQQEEKKKPFTIKPSIKKLVSKNISIMAYDFETYNDNIKGCVPYCLCLYGEQKQYSFYGDDNKIIIDFIDMLDREYKHESNISKTNNRKKIPYLYIYGFNNSRFDNVFLYKELVRRNPNIKLLIQDSNIKYIKYHNILFFDLSLFYLGSLSAVAQSFKIEETKMAYPYNFVNKNNLYYNDITPLNGWNDKKDYDKYKENYGEFMDLQKYTIEYCLRDCELVYKIVLKHFENCIGEINFTNNEGKIVKRHFNVITSKTAAALSFNIFNQVFQCDVLNGSPLNIQDLERMAYKGGRTEVFIKKFNEKIISEIREKLGQNKQQKERLYYYDINSSYPYAMTKHMPYEFVSHFKYDEKECIYNNKNETNIEKTNLYYARCVYGGAKPINLIPNLLYRDDKNLTCTLLEYPYSYHWGIELMEAIKLGYKVYIKETIKYTKNKVFKPFADYMYNERLQCKKSNPVKSLFLKTCMNSLYGKFGQNIKESSKLCSNMYEKNLIFNNPHYKILDFKFLDDEFELIKYKCDTDKNTNVGNLIRFASYITAIARTRLSRMMRTVQNMGGNVYYCDTDSIQCDIQIPEKYINQTILGKWKLESKELKKIVIENEIEKEITKEIPAILTQCDFIAPKTYMNIYDSEEYKDFVDYDVSVIKAKGIPNKLVNMEHINNVVNGKPQPIKNPKLFKRDLNGVHIIEQERTLDVVYNKRIWINEYTSTPYKNLDERQIHFKPE